MDLRFVLVDCGLLAMDYWRIFYSIKRVPNSGLLEDSRFEPVDSEVLVANTVPDPPAQGKIMF